jgi:hypothetical protein
MLALPEPMVLAASESTPNTLLTAVVVVCAVAVLVSIALDLRKLRRSSRLRAVHGVLGAAFSMVVVGGALALSMALGTAPSATADQPDAPATWQVPAPESIDTSDVTDPSTDIQLPTLGIE